MWRGLRVCSHHRRPAPTSSSAHLERSSCGAQGRTCAPSQLRVQSALRGSLSVSVGLRAHTQTHICSVLFLTTHLCQLYFSWALRKRATHDDWSSCTWLCSTNARIPGTWRTSVALAAFTGTVTSLRSKGESVQVAPVKLCEGKHVFFMFLKVVQSDSRCMM